MHKLEQLKDELITELESYAGVEKTVEHAMHIKCLASAVDHLCNICKDADEDEMSSQRSMRMRSNRSERSYDDGSSYDDGMAGRRSGNRYAVERGRAWADGPSKESIKMLEELKGTGDDYTRRVVGQVLRELRG